MKNLEKFKKEIMPHMAEIIEIDLGSFDDYDFEERTIEYYCEHMLDCKREEIEYLLGFDILALADDELQEEFGYEENKVLIKISDNQVCELLEKFFKQVLIYDYHFKENFKTSKKQYEKFFNIDVDDIDFR